MASSCARRLWSPIIQRAGVRNDTPVLVYTGKGAFKGWGDGLEQTMMAYGLTQIRP